MLCKTDNFDFDPNKTALENLFALIYRTNRVKLDPKYIDVELPQVFGPDEHGDNTTIRIVSKPGSPFKGTYDLYYARADIDTHYPVFELDLKDVADIHDTAALIAYLDGRFNLVDGEVDIDIEDPFNSLFEFLNIGMMAKDSSYIYIGNKTIHLFWSEGIRRITEEGILRITDEGVIRYVENGSLD